MVAENIEVEMTVEFIYLIIMVISTGETSNGYLYIYNAGDSSKYTFLTSQFSTFRDTAEIQTNFNSGVYDQTATVNGLQFQTSGGNLEFGTFSLYGIKEYS